MVATPRPVSTGFMRGVRDAGLRERREGAAMPALEAQLPKSLQVLSLLLGELVGHLDHQPHPEVAALTSLTGKALLWDAQAL